MKDMRKAIVTAACRAPLMIVLGMALPVSVMASPDDEVTIRMMDMNDLAADRITSHISLPSADRHDRDHAGDSVAENNDRSDDHDKEDGSKEGDDRDEKDHDDRDYDSGSDKEHDMEREDEMEREHEQEAEREGEHEHEMENERDDRKDVEHEGRDREEVERDETDHSDDHEPDDATAPDAGDSDQQMMETMPNG